MEYYDRLLASNEKPRPNRLSLAILQKKKPQQFAASDCPKQPKLLRSKPKANPQQLIDLIDIDLESHQKTPNSIRNNKMFQPPVSQKMSINSNLTQETEAVSLQAT